MKKIILIATGGTISAIGSNRLDRKDYHTGSMTGKEMVAHLPEMAQIADVDVEQLVNVSSTHMSAKHWIQLRDKVHHYLNEKAYDGVVITHGTNTLEETAYFLHLTVNTEKPIVLVGAQRPYSALGSDAPLNLLNAVRVAADAASVGKGVLVVLNNEVSSARDVSKMDTYRLEAFQSGPLGALGHVDPDDTVQFYREPLRKHTARSQFAKLPINTLPDVAIVYSYAGADGGIIRHITESGKYRGIVVAGTGAGRCSPEEDEALCEAVEGGMVVVRSSRVGSGRVVDIEAFRSYACVTADNLLPQKARILLMLSLLVDDNVREIQHVFDHY